MKKYKRICPGCGKDIFHSTEKYCKSREKKKTLCKSCGCNRSDRLKRMSEINKGDKNPFFGKKHSDDSRSKIANRDYSVNQTDDFRRKISLAVSGSGNPMYGRSYYDVWVEKYGREEADRRMIKVKRKKSVQMSGRNNPMYGKQSPQGSGNGWSGWYDGWFFRSLKELSYVIRVMEKNGHSWRSAEANDLGIEYTIDGRSRTYFADFLVDESILVEVKPKRLMESRINSLKKEAAIRFCKEKGYSYRMVDVRVLEDDVIVNLYKNGLVKFIDRYELKMKDRLIKSKGERSEDKNK